MTYNKIRSLPDKNLKSQNKIGLFDSGVGGLTVMRELAAVLPHEEMIYLGDTARLPYGNKSPETVVKFAQDNAQFLLEQNIKLLVIPCHTACTHALDILSSTLPVPVVGVTQSSVASLLVTTKTKRVAVLGTLSTISSGQLQSQLLSHDPSLHIFSVPCPLFVPLVEENLHSHPAAQLIVEHYLSHLRSQSIDAALLACTHYPLLAPLIQQTLGPTVQLVLPAHATALAAKTILQQHNLLNTSSSTPNHLFFSSDDPHKFKQSASLFFPHPIPTVHLRTS